MEVLQLSGNLINSVGAGAFDELVRNLLTMVDQAMFRGLDNLFLLQLQDNVISSIAEESFKNLKKLKRLYLPLNDLTHLTTRMFKGLESVNTLSFYDNNIISVEKGTFPKLNNLKHLALSFNDLEEIPDGMFDGLDSTDEIGIYLSNNSLTTIPCAPFAKIRRPVILDISGNPLDCDRSLCWLKQEVETGTITWLKETERKQREPVGHIYKTRCANGTNWNDIMWGCGQGRSLNISSTVPHSFIGINK